MEFYPLGVTPDLSGMVLHESGYIACNDWWIFPNVMSPFWRLHYNFQNGHKVIFPSREYTITPEHIMLIPDHQLFHCYGTERVSTFWLTFSTTRRLHPDQKIPVLLRPNTAEMELIHRVTEFYSPRPASRNRSRIFHYSLALLNIVLERPELRWLDQPLQANIIKVIRHIEHAFSSSLAIPDLARMSGMSVRGFSKAFKRHQGSSTVKFITQVRVREAAQLLANSQETVDTIAEKTGFPNRDYFSRVFKKITGESPGLFRQQHGIHSA